MPDDNIEHPPRGYTTSDAERIVEEPRRPRRWKLKALVLSVLLVPFALVALWTWITLSFTYSSGERAGYVQKFSKKGWLCKTWEGELAMANLPGTMPQIFAFTVRNDAVAEELNQQMGKRVAIKYEQHRGVPFSCFGETQYFVTDVEVVGQ